MKLSHFDTSPDVTESTYVQEVPLTEDSDIPVPGDTIRTPKLEGKVSKVEEGYVYFTTADGRNMRNTIPNCTVIEKLADQESEMFEDEEIDEVSTELLAKYKTAAGKDASAADKKGDYARGNKRFSGIVKATKKQFDNDAKKTVNELTIPGVEDNFTADDIKRLEQLTDMPTLKAQAKELVKGKAARRMKPEKISWFYNAIDGKTNRMAIIKLMYDLLLAGEGNSVVGTRNSMRQNDYRDRFGEGSMGGINRSAPSNDVSYEKVLDEVQEKWNEEQVNELSVGKLQAYKDAAKSPASFRNRPLRKLARTIQGVKGATDRIDTKTGNRRPGPGPERGNNESVGTDEAITPWGGYTADDPKANALAKAPKSAMQGKGDIRFSELVQDSIKAHGLKWSFNEYVIKHGLPPRQFQIFAGLATKPKAVEPAKPDWSDPSTATKPAAPQSWWQKLRGKLPFEE